MKSKKIVFWSAVNADSVLRDVILDLVGLGYVVEMKYLVEESDYRNSTGLLHSIVKKIIIYIIFPFYYTFGRGYFKKKSINIVTTNPFLLPFFATLFKRNQSKVIQLVWDLYPHAIQINGRNDRNGYLTAFLCYFIKILVGYSFRHSSANVFISRSMIDSAKSTFDLITKPVLIPVGASNGLLSRAPRICDGNNGINAIYSGNLGRMHDFDTFANSFSSPKFSEICLSGLNVSFYSFGANYGKLVEYLKNNDNCENLVKLEGALETYDWSAKMKNSHLSLISLSVGAELAALPSKTYSAMAAGHAIVGICSSQSELGKLIIEHNCGWVVEPGDSNGLLTVLDYVVQNPNDLYIKRCNSFKISNDLFSSSSVAMQWAELFNSL